MTLENLANTLREHPFLQGFTAEHIDKLAAMASEVRFGKGALIFREGDESSFFYLLLAGKVALETNAPGRIVRIVTVGPGEELGWSSVTPSHSKQFQARSLEETQALAFDGVRLQHACDEDCRFGYTLMTAMLRVVAHRLQSTRLQLLDMYSPCGAGSQPAAASQAAPRGY
jgi:CRP/FNR family transcriptional regulator, cyclic AMP receptor protein